MDRTRGGGGVGVTNNELYLAVADMRPEDIEDFSIDRMIEDGSCLTATG